MQLQTTYPNNNYPIIVEHNAFEELSEYIQDYDKVFLIIDEYVDFNFKTKFMPLLESTPLNKDEARNPVKSPVAPPPIATKQVLRVKLYSRRCSSVC